MGVASEGGWLVAGIGNRWASDDGIGLLLVGSLAGRPLGCGTETVLWEDADALTLTHELLERNRPTLIVDCADMGSPSGDWRHFPSGTARLALRADPLSSHGLGIAEALSLASSLGFGQPVEIFAVQPFDVSPGPALSTAMQRRLPGLVDALCQVVGSLPGADMGASRASASGVFGLRPDTAEDGS